MSPGPRKEWVSFAAQDSAFFHALIGSTASHLAYKRNQDGDNIDYFHHRGKAISLVNKAISNGNAATEGIVGTVAAFLQQDVGLKSDCSSRLFPNETSGPRSCEPGDETAPKWIVAARQAGRRDQLFST
jgi:hypothetical protein